MDKNNSNSNNNNVVLIGRNKGPLSWSSILGSIPENNRDIGCNFCHDKFSSLSDFSNHLNLCSGIPDKGEVDLVIDEESLQLTCPSCDNIISTREDLLNHIGCETVAKQTRLKFIFNKMLSETKEDFSFECYVCNHKFKTKKNRDKHVEKQICLKKLDNVKSGKLSLNSECVTFDVSVKKGIGDYKLNKMTFTAPIDEVDMVTIDDNIVKVSLPIRTRTIDI